MVKTEPDWSRLPEATAPAIRTLLRRCLRKDRRQRIPDAADVRIEIEDAIAAPKDSGATQAAPASTSKLLVAVAAALAIIAVVALWGWWRATRPIEQALRPLVRLDVDLGPDVSLGSIAGTDEIISPDGTRMVYVSQGRLFTRRLDQPNATELAGTQGAYRAFLLPGRAVGCFLLVGKAAKDFGGGRLGNHLVQRAQWPGRQLGRGWQHHRGAQHQWRLVADSFRRRSANASDRLAERRGHPPLAANPARRQGRVVHG